MIPAFFLCIGLALIVSCPPLWRDYDGLVQISDKPGDMVILHYPPAYPLFSRLHVFAADTVDGWLHGRHVSIYLRRVVHLNDAGIHALMFSQQLLLAAALTALVWQVGRSGAARWSMAVLFATNASLFIVANLISTEALAEPVTVALVAIAIANFCAAEIRASRLLLYGVVLVVAILTRHAHEVFAMLLPLALILRVLHEWVSTRRFPAELGRKFAIFVGIGVVSILAAQGIIRLLCHEFDIPYRSIATRATVERLGFVKRLPPAERTAFLEGLQNQTNDPVVKEAIPLLARNATWVEQRDEIEKLLVRDSPTLSGDALKVKADAYLEQVTTLYFQTHHPALTQGTLNATRRAFTATTPADLSVYFLQNGAASLDLYASRPNLSKKTKGLQVCSPEMKSRIDSFARNPWLQVWAWAPHGLVLLAASIGAGYLLIRRSGDAALPLFALAIVCTDVVITLFTFYFVDYHPRRTAATELLGFIALAIVVAHALDLRTRKAQPDS